MVCFFGPYGATNHMNVYLFSPFSTLNTNNLLLHIKPSLILANNTFYTMADLIDIELPDPIFDTNFWIRKGKKYPKNPTPSEVSTIRNKILSIPQHVKENLPNPQLSIAQFIQQDLLPQSSAIDTTKNSQWFSNTAPVTSSCHTLRHILVCTLTYTYILIQFVAPDHFSPFTGLVSDYSEISIFSSYVPFRITYAYLPL